MILRDLSSEYYSFSDVNASAIGSMPGRSMLPLLFDAFDSITNSSDPSKLRLVAISYKPFIGLFNLTGAAQDSPQLAGVVNYAAAAAFEIRKETTTNSYTVTLQFKNGTDDADFVPYTMFGSSDPAYDLESFTNQLSVS